MYDGNDDKIATEFLHFYHKFKFLEIKSDEMIAAQAKRMQLILSNLQCNKWDDRAAARFLLKEHLDKYCKTVDNRDGINNYAGYIKIVCNKLSRPIAECSKWRSNLRNSNNVNSIAKDLKLDIKSVVEQEIDDMVFKQLIQNQKRKEQFISALPVSSIENESQSARICTSSVEKNNRCIFPQIKPTYSKSLHYRNLTRNNTAKKDEREETAGSSFRSAKTELQLQNLKKYRSPEMEASSSKETVAIKRSLGTGPKFVNKKFIPPIKNNDSLSVNENNVENENLKNLDPKMIELIKNEIMDHGNPVTWNDIAGLEFAKKTIQEIVVWPLLRPDIFTGLRRPPKGILLFGPPGTGKTLIGKCIASQSTSTFFSISASSLTSKWIGESEKLVRTLFAVARCHQPAVIFIDEIDSLLSQRNEIEHESSRRIKTEFLVQLDGAATSEDDRILVIGATNRPQELDEAARRRLVKRLYIPLPDFQARRQIVQRLMNSERNDLTEDNVDEIAKLTDGYSGADMKNLCQEASLGPIRSIDFRLISSIESQEVRPVSLIDFSAAINVVRSSVSSDDLSQCLEWNKIYGSGGN